MLNGESITFFDEYSALAGSGLATVSGNWIDSTAEFLERLEADKNLLATTFLGGKDPGPVMDVKAGLSDPHNGGRTVLALTFSSGLKLVYKPKSVALKTPTGSFSIG